jgi:hypothetical protein
VPPSGSHFQASSGICWRQEVFGPSRPGVKPSRRAVVEAGVVMSNADASSLELGEPVGRSTAGAGMRKQLGGHLAQALASVLRWGCRGSWCARGSLD